MSLKGLGIGLVSGHHGRVIANLRRDLGFVVGSVISYKACFPVSKDDRRQVTRHDT